MSQEMILANRYPEFGRLATIADNGRNDFLRVQESGANRVLATMVKADAMLSVLEAAEHPNVAACLLRLANPRLQLVERVGNSENAEVVRVMALALFLGFTPGENEFAIYGAGKTSSSLYIKEMGYYRILQLLGCTDIHVDDGHPYTHEFKPGEQVWAAEGTVSCTFRGKRYVVTFGPENFVAIPLKTYRGSSESSDQIDGVKTKIRRRMLQALWRRVKAEAGALIDDEHDTDDGATGTGTVTVIEASAAPVTAADFTDDVAALQTKLTPDHARLLGDAHADIAAATSGQQLRTVWEAINAASREIKLDKRALDLLIRIKDAKKGELQ